MITAATSSTFHDGGRSPREQREGRDQVRDVGTPQPRLPHHQRHEHRHPQHDPGHREAQVDVGVRGVDGPARAARHGRRSRVKYRTRNATPARATATTTRRSRSHSVLTILWSTPSVRVRRGEFAWYVYDWAQTRLRPGARSPGRRRRPGRRRWPRRPAGASFSALDAGVPTHFVSYGSLEAGIKGYADLLQALYKSCAVQLFTNPTAADWYVCLGSKGYYGHNPNAETLYTTTRGKVAAYLKGA